MKITKRYSQKITIDYNSWEFLTELEREVDVKSAEELIAESDKLFKNARALTLRDIEATKDNIKPLKLPNGGKQ
jgi:phage tail protein X